MKITFKPNPKPEPKAKKSQQPLNRKAIKKRFNPTGEGEMFKILWNEREHICINCKVHLGDEARAFYFAHIKSKKQHPELRLEKTNIQLLCLHCHHEFDHGTKESYTKRFKD